MQSFSGPAELESIDVTSSSSSSDDVDDDVDDETMLAEMATEPKQLEAARAIGASTTRILLSHVVPNVLSIVIVYLTLTIPAVMLFEAFLSFLGLGIEPPKVSWGTLAVDGTEAINPLKIFWWLVFYPAIAMGSTLLALNILGDGLRDALDPKLRGKD